MLTWVRHRPAGLVPGFLGQASNTTSKIDLPGSCGRRGSGGGRGPYLPRAKGRGRLAQCSPPPAFPLRTPRQGSRLVLPPLPRCGHWANGSCLALGGARQVAEPSQAPLPPLRLPPAEQWAPPSRAHLLSSSTCTGFCIGTMGMRAASARGHTAGGKPSPHCWPSPVLRCASSRFSGATCPAGYSELLATVSRRLLQGTANGSPLLPRGPPALLPPSPASGVPNSPPYMLPPGVCWSSSWDKGRGQGLGAVRSPSGAPAPTPWAFPPLHRFQSQPAPRAAVCGAAVQTGRGAPGGRGSRKRIGSSR